MINETGYQESGPQSRALIFELVILTYEMGASFPRDE